MRGLPIFLSLFRYEIYKFNNTRARILDYIYIKHMLWIIYYYYNGIIRGTSTASEPLNDYIILIYDL